MIFLKKNNIIFSYNLNMHSSPQVVVTSDVSKSLAESWAWTIKIFFDCMLWCSTGTIIILKVSPCTRSRIGPNLSGAMVLKLFLFPTPFLCKILSRPLIDWTHVKHKVEFFSVKCTYVSPHWNKTCNFINQWFYL